MMSNQGARSGSVSQMRREQRMKVLLSGELRLGSVTAICRIHDISRGGVCVECDGPVRRGDAVQFMRGSIRASGIVAWVGRRRLGIRFDAPIRATELLVQMSQSRQAREAGSQPGVAMPVLSGPCPSR